MSNHTTDIPTPWRGAVKLIAVIVAAALTLLAVEQLGTTAGWW